MTEPRFADLSEREHQCLQHVCRHRQSKEIARELGIAKRTVDGHLDSARVKLNAISRVEAARLYLARYGATPPYRITGDPIPLSPLPETPEIEPATTTVSRAADNGYAAGVSEAWTPFVHDLPAPAATSILPISTPGRPSNDLDAWQRLIAIGRIASKLILYPALVLAAAQALSKLALTFVGR